MGRFLYVRCVSSVVLFPWVQDLRKPRDGRSHLGPMFGCGVTFAHGGSSRNKDLSAAQRKFAHSLRDFKFEFIGDAETDDERYLDASLHEFSNFLKNLEEQREILALSVTETLIKPLERFRKEQLGAVKEEKKKFDKETEKNYSLLEKHLNLSAKKKELQLQEADNQVEQNRKHFYELSLEYVCKLQEIQERKKFECVEPVLSFFQGLFTFYHQGYELAKDFNHYKMALQINIQNTRNRFEGTRSEVEELMNKIRRNPQEHKRANHFTMEGYLYVQEKRPAPFGSSWVKHYCMYRKETKKFTMIPFEHRSGGKVGDEELFVLMYCTKRNIDTIDRRFCFDLEASDRPGVPVTMQAFSEEDRKLWMEALDGKEALFINLNRTNAKREGSAQLDKIGFTVIKKCISAVETRGINDQGLYRVVGVSSKVQRLLSLLMDAKTCNEVDLENSVDWEVKTITSAMKQYLRSLPEPLMTYELHGEFIIPAKSGSPESRVNAVHFLVHKLPEKNKEMLEILVKHLANVSKHAKRNLMTVANLGVVFGPTLMRPQEETVAAIMDLKFQNIVVEILIENHEKIFKTLPDATFPEPISMSVSPPNAPPRQSRRQGQRIKRPLAVYNLCLELDDADSHSSPREDTPTGSMDSLSSQSPTPAFSSSPSGLLDGNHLIMDSGDLAGWTTNLPGQSRPSMVSWMNTPSANPAATNTASSTFFFPNPATGSDRTVESIAHRKARAVYPCEAEHSSELSFQIGAIFEDVQFSREPGWLEGTLNGKRGLIPQNYVQFL
ncbi:PREDICTED: rho GTPase-activating protein 10 [Pygoscelis adeliae]|uniref:rho GTPase-activating protein 10 n=1 Tax=Pygoscelis adeliae TaxID=9238 RepID=UPI0004F4E64F|nr:PREDICTED: rho GTPase-activating protein 10 [Pygoscelis adeliae]